ncbi:MAG: AMP-binding protein [Magnetospirillum sp.]|nr:AMP-binding protein [Magnetospirillum sp.]
MFERLAQADEADAVVWRGRTISYRELLASVSSWEARLRAMGLQSGASCGIVGDFSPSTIALLLALLRLGAVAVPVSPDAAREMAAITTTASISCLFSFDADDNVAIELFEPSPRLPLLADFSRSGAPGLVVFTSGSSGKPKAILHDANRVLGKFERPRPGHRMLMCLMFDHFGGLNTLFACLSYGGTAICLPQRKPEFVCAAIESARADLLPTTPTFLRMILASDAWRTRDLSSLKVISFGAEPMPPSTLALLRETFPKVELKQTYGLSELGVLHSKSPDPSSLWLRIGGHGFETKVHDGVLYVRSASSMVGYLNADSPLDAEGWMCTNDLVEEKDGLFRFLGRTSEIVNVGGNKVHPSEVEEVLMQAPNVADATVVGIPHPLLGHAVGARISLVAPEDERAASTRLRRFCLERIAKFKVPMRFEFLAMEALATVRAKKQRTNVPSGKENPKDGQ